MRSVCAKRLIRFNLYFIYNISFVFLLVILNNAVFIFRFIFK